MSRTPYITSDDSVLLRRMLGSASGRSCLEMGAGNGGALLDLAERFEVIVGTDVLKPGMTDWSPTSNYILADAATCFRSACFDLVVFNPPYLRSEDYGDCTVEGGKGLEVPLSFLQEALRVVKPAGKIVFLLNEEADLTALRSELRKSGFELVRVASQRMFFEELSVYVASVPASGALAGDLRRTRNSLGPSRV